MNSLEKTLIDAWNALSNAARDRHSTFHLAKIATVTPDGRPTQRTVVLRDANADTRELRFHTDTRSDKVAEISNNPAVSLISYDPATKVQIRIDGHATVHVDDDIASAAWSATQDFSKACYLAPDAPGTNVESPPAAPVYKPDADHAAYEHFCAVTINVERLEWLHLAAQGHKRAMYEWRDDDTPVMSWISP